MNYEQLVSLVGGSNPKSATYEDIISGIQSQYRPQTQFAPTRSLLESIGTLVPDQPRIAYGSLLQAQPRKAITPIDMSKYAIKTVDDITGGLIGGDGGAGGNDGSGATTSGNAGFTIGPDGVATPNTVSQGLASVVGMVTGLPMGLVASISNAANTAAANAANAAMAQADVDSTATAGNTATAGVTGTGGAAATAGTTAASTVSSMGLSDSAAAVAGQTAANASISGMSVSDSVAAGVAAGVAADGGVGAPSGIGDGVGDGTAFAKGGMVTMDRLMGANPIGQDDGYASLQSGEYVIKKDAVDKYGEEFFGLLNSGKLTKKQIKSLL
jgi:hypothetical protein